MGILHGLWLLVLGGLGASSLVARRAEGRRALAALEPYQGWIGAASALVGVWRLIQAVLELGLVGRWFTLWILLVADGVLLLTLGLLLGVGVFRSFVKSPSGQAKLDEWTRRLQPYRERLGIAALVLGAYLILRALF
jgi:hypothetical protein